MFAAHQKVNAFPTLKDTIAAEIGAHIIIICSQCGVTLNSDYSPQVVAGVHVQPPEPRPLLLEEEDVDESGLGTWILLGRCS